MKQVTTGEGAFTYTSPLLGNFTITTTGSTGQRLFTGLMPGSYAVTETPAQNWQLLSATCSNGSPVDAITIAAGEDVTCTFVSQPAPTGLPVEDEPLMSNSMFLPLVNR